ncbi:hypothetical protein ACRRTK_019106 [Alexandromys fortis]
MDLALAMEVTDMDATALHAVNVLLADMHKTIEADVGIHAQIFRLAQSGNELTL